MSRLQERLSLRPKKDITDISKVFDQVRADDAALKAAAQKGSIDLITNPLNLPSRQVYASAIRATDAVVSKTPSPSSATSDEITGHIARNSSDKLKSVFGQDAVAYHAFESGENGTPNRVIFPIDASTHRKENPDLDAVKKKLLELVQIQQAEDANCKNRKPKLGSQEDNIQLISAYHQDPRFFDLVHELLYPNPQLFVGDDYPTRRRRAMSRIFELIAYDQEFWRINDEEDGALVLDSDKTLKFYHVRFPYDNITHYEFGLAGIYGIGVPDFIIVRDGVIKTVAEVTSAANPNYFHKKFTSFQRAKDSEEHGILYTDANLAFVVTDDLSRKRAQAFARQFKGVEANPIEGIRIADIKILMGLVKQQVIKTISTEHPSGDNNIVSSSRSA